MWMTKLRKRWASLDDVATANQCEVEGHPAWERALVPRPSKPMAEASKEATFRWVVEPEGGMLEGTAYSDGSFLDGPIIELARGGWAFAVLDDDGIIVASAYGVPPPWIKDIGGAETWGVLQVGLRGVPGKIKYMIDCQPCVLMVHGGIDEATTANRPLARVNAMVMSVLEDTPVEKVVWMPAHKSKQAAGQFRCSDGNLITAADIKGNAEADRLAKLAVRLHRVHVADVKHWEAMCKHTLKLAKWVARATWAASNCDDPPSRDTEASQWRAEAFRKEAKAKREAEKTARDRTEQDDDDGRQDLRGHDPVKVLQPSGIRSGWRCTLCRRISSKKELLTSRRCTGCPLIDWSTIQQDSDEEAPSALTRPHRRMMRGTVLWCFRCGVYGDKKAKGLKNECKGRPPRQAHRGGMEGQLRKLRNGIHPKTGECLPQAVELDPVVVSLEGSSQDEQRKPPDGFYVYVPADLKPEAAAVVEGGPSSIERRLAFLDRIRAKELANSRTRGDVISDVLSVQHPHDMTKRACDGTPADGYADGVSSQTHGSISGPVAGGGVWSYLFPDEDQMHKEGSDMNKEGNDNIDELSSRGLGAHGNCGTGDGKSLRALDEDGMRRFNDGEPSHDVTFNVVVRQGAVSQAALGTDGGDGKHSQKDVQSLVRAGRKTGANDQDDDLTNATGEGLGASSDIGDVNCRGLGASSGAGLVETHSRGWCALSLPSLPVLPSPPRTLQRGCEAPPGGRPYMNVIVPVEHMEPHSVTEAGEQQGMCDALVTRSISYVYKCKGRYRIRMKGAACHGKACCLGI